MTVAKKKICHPELVEGSAPGRSSEKGNSHLDGYELLVVSGKWIGAINPDLPYDILPAALKNPEELLHDCDGDIGLSVLDLLDVPLAEISEIGQLGLSHLGFHAKTVDVLSNNLASFHVPQLARNAIS